MERGGGGIRAGRYEKGGGEGDRNLS
jgi:hypothetical protein